MEEQFYREVVLKKLDNIEASQQDTFSQVSMCNIDISGIKKDISYMAEHLARLNGSIMSHEHRIDVIEDGANERELRLNTIEETTKEKQLSRRKLKYIIIAGCLGFAFQFVMFGIALIVKL